jgi:excisionase family DNA binding protein
METYLTIEELAGYLKLAVQTIRRWVLNREIPFHKIKKVIRFRVSEIENWIDKGGLMLAEEDSGGSEGDLFQGAVSPAEKIMETASTQQCARTEGGVV